MRPSLSLAVKILLLCYFAILAVCGAVAQVTGAAFTSEPVNSVPCSPATCVPDLSPGAVFTVNSNLYPAKVDVFINGGPRNDNHKGLTPPSSNPGDMALYYFQVTDPNGSVLLSADPAACRLVDVVTDAAGSGRVDGLDPSVLSNPNCPARVVLPDPASGTTANPVEMCPPASGRADTLGDGAPLYDPNNWCDNTPNPGGEYKAFLIRADNATVAPDGIHLIFGNQDSQTDNFKVLNGTSAFIEVCKFNDNGAGGGTAGNGIQDGAEPLIPHWPINAVGVDTDSGIGTVNTQTSDDGCVQPPFSVSTFSNGSATVTLTENLLTGWTETAPLNGMYDLNANSGCTTNCATSVAGFTETITVTPGETVVAPNFGNNLSGSPDLTLTVTKTASPSFTRTFTWNITKTATGTTTLNSLPTVFSAGGGTSDAASYTVDVSHDNGTDSGWQVSGVITVSNANSVDITGIDISDADTANGNCVVQPAADGTPITNATIAANSHEDFPYTCIYPAAPAAGTNTNTATATPEPTSNTTGGPFVGFATWDFSTASIKFVDGSVTVTDTFGGTLGTVTINSDGTITVTGGVVDGTNPAQADFTYTHTFTGDPAGTCTSHQNTATFTTNTTGTTGTSSATVQDCQGADLQVSKSAVPSFNSSVTKSVDKTTVQQSGGNVTFNYTVTVTESGWQVAGSITVVNPNDWETVSGVTVTDAINNGGSCSVTGGTGVSIGPKSSAQLSYTCTYSSAPTSASFTNTATATWTAATYHTPDGTASGQAISGQNGTNPFATLTITDTVYSSAFPSGCTATLGTVSVTTTTPSATPGCGVTALTSPSYGVFKYSITDTNAAPGMCASYNNTAQITGGSSSNQVTVTVCNTNTGALTMGFWKNNNGQKLINGANQANLATFLTSYNPFKDYPQKSGQSIASYVSTVIGAATCGGSTCNPMLKAQMLATALDVFFSNPANGDPIKAFNGGITLYLGNVNIDLSHVCAMVDLSGGSSCSSSFEDARPEFGINPASTTPACLGTSVLNMLAYSDLSSSTNGSPVSNNGGSNWYNQVKTRQVFAKDSFDSTNNQVANIATQSCSPSF